MNRRKKNKDVISIRKQEITDSSSRVFRLTAEHDGKNNAPVQRKEDRSLEKKKFVFFFAPCYTIKEGNEGRGNLLTAHRHMERVLYHHPAPAFLYVDNPPTKQSYNRKKLK